MKIKWDNGRRVLPCVCSMILDIIISLSGLVIIVPTCPNGPQWALKFPHAKFIKLITCQACAGFTTGDMNH